jgi:hypothetical protein
MLRLGTLVLLTPLFLTGCPKDDEVECFDDRTCGKGMRCISAGAGMKGVCGPCDGIEVPYDGVDNDCNTATRDRDLDGDGENPPGDCNDNDPAVGSMKTEICMDAKDNDCDTQIDEVDCGDVQPPTLVINLPVEGELVSQTFDINFDVSDDVGVVEARVFIASAQIDERQFLPSVRSQTVVVSVDTIARQIADGTVTVSVEIEDVAGKETSATRTITIDNFSPPAIMLNAPLNGGFYGGDLTVDATVMDGSGVGTVRILRDGIELASLTSPPYTANIDTSALVDGSTSTVTVEATDLRGNLGSSTVRFIVDNTAPIVTFNTPMPNDVVSLIIPVEVMAVDPNGRVDAVYSNGNVAPGAGATGTLLYMFDTETVFPNGPYTITASAADTAIVDNAGPNVGIGSVIVDVQNVDRGPTITLTPADGSGVVGPTDIIAVVTPGDDPVDTVTIDVDGNGISLFRMVNTYTGSYDFSLVTGPTSVILVTATDLGGRVRTLMAIVNVSRPPTFRAAPSWDVDNGFTEDGFAVGDLTGDAIADVLAGGGDLRLFPGIVDSGRYRLGDPVIIDPRSLSDVRLVDTNNDGDIDYAITLYQNQFRGWRNNGGLSMIAWEATITQPTAAPDFTVFEVGDLDGDGDPDIVAGGPNGFDFVMLRNMGNASLQFDNVYGLVANTRDLHIADVDLDGDNDVVVGRAGSSEVVTVYRNTGTGSFFSGQDAFTIIQDPMQYVTVGDVTGDAYPDIVATIAIDPGTLPQLGYLVTLEGDPAQPGNFNEIHDEPLQSQARSVVLGDVDGDGNLDAVVAVKDGNGVDVLLNPNNDGMFERSAGWVMARDTLRAELFDLENDGDLDIVGSGFTDGVIAVARNLGNAEFFAAPVFPYTTNLTAIAAGDVIGGPGPDLVLDFTNGLNVDILEHTGGVTLVSRGQLNTMHNVSTSVAVGDLDGAGKLDIILAGTASSLMINTSVGVVPSALVSVIDYAPGGGTSPHNSVDAVIADVNNDGLGEAVFTYGRQSPPPPDYGSEVYGVNAMAMSTMLRQHSAAQGARSLAAGDLGGDPNGYVDYVHSNSISADMTVSFWSGAGWLTTSITGLPMISDVAIGRVGNDSFGDIIAVGAPGLIVLEGGPANSFLPARMYPAGMSAIRVTSADFNRDGLNDALVINGDERCSVLIADPQGGFLAPLRFVTGSGPADGARADFDGDGRDDMAVLMNITDGVMVLYSNGDTL